MFFKTQKKLRKLQENGMEFEAGTQILEKDDTNLNEAELRMAVLHNCRERKMGKKWRTWKGKKRKWEMGVEEQVLGFICLCVSICTGRGRAMLNLDRWILIGGAL